MRGYQSAILHKSFRPAKCKTALKLAASRIKLLKNKREAQVKQLKRGLAQLLEAGQDQTARIRVEHLVREEKTMAAYDLVEIYCELIVARLTMIESQKNCPIDLKEAIASVIFASPRCADIPELMDVRKHFTAKYGKEFVSAAVELRPDCGVSRLLVEKLSAKAPDGPTKIKILSAIAEEHNVNWDPKSFGEIDMEPPEDLLNGPNTFEQASETHMEPPKIPEPPNNVDKGHPTFRAPSEHYEKHDIPVNSYNSNSKPSPYFQNVSSSAVGDSSKAMPSGTSHPDLRPLGSGSEEMEFRHSYAAEQSGFSSSRQSWNMEFKDATAAAQAAAESAERASMAARLAAELSSQGMISRQHSTESKKASGFRSRDDELKNYASSRLQDEHLAKDAVNNTSHRSNSGLSQKESFKNEQDDLEGLTERFYSLKNSNKSSQLVSSKSGGSFVDDHPQVSDFQMADRHSRKSSSELEESDLLGEENIKRESSESEGELIGEMHDRMRFDSVVYFEEASIRKQSSGVSSHHSQIPTDDPSVISSFSHQSFREEAVEEPFIFNEGKSQSNTKETNSFDNAAVVFDDSGSDDDEFNFDEKGKHNEHDSSSYYLSEGRKSSSHLLENTGAKSRSQNIEDSGKFSSQSPFASASGVFSEGLVSDTATSQADDLLPVTFDDSDGPSSESEGEPNKSKLVGSTHTGFFPHKDTVYSGDAETTDNKSPQLIGSSVAEKENFGYNRKTWIQPSSLDSDIEVHSERKKGIKVGAETDKKFSYGDLQTDQTSYVLPKSQSKSNDDDNLKINGLSPVKDDVKRNESLDTLKDIRPIKESSFKNGKELDFGKLTGGIRNKGYRHPPYHRNLLNNSLVSKHAEDYNSSRIEQSSPSPKLGIGSGAYDQVPFNRMVHPNVNKKVNSGTPVAYSMASDDDSDEELTQQTINSSQEPYVQKASTEVNKKSGLRSYFDSDNSDSEDDLPKIVVTSKTSSAPGFSRRTKASLPNSERNSYLKSRGSSEPSVTADYHVKQQSSSSSSYATKTQVMPPSKSRSSGYRGSSEQGRLAEEATSKPISQSKRSVHEESSSSSSYATEIRQNSLQSKSSEYWGGSEHHQSAEPSKPILESKRSSSKENRNSSARKQPSNPVAAGGAESRNTFSSHGDAPSRENSINKASHVHPKLPDYDALTAHLLSLRQNRQ